MRPAYLTIAAVTLALVACTADENDSSSDGAAAVTACKTKSPSSPPMCPQNVQPVCGCDGKTYGNKCQAAAYVGTWSEGACGGSAAACEVKAPKVKACAEIYEPVCGCNGKTYGNACEAETYVTSWDDGACAAPPPAACKVATPEPRACAQIYEPVCGCDGKTYGNACSAEDYVTSWVDGACK